MSRAPSSVAWRDTTDHPAAHAVRTVAVAALLIGLGAGVGSYVTSPAHELHDPVTGLQQLDLFFLDEPAPASDRLGLRPGTRALVLVCGDPLVDGEGRRAPVAPAVDCAAPPDLDPRVQVVHVDEPEIATAYGLVTADGRVGPGYALVDARNHVRYRTFDPAPARHASELRVLIANL